MLAGSVRRSFVPFERLHRIRAYDMIDQWLFVVRPHIENSAGQNNPCGQRVLRFAPRLRRTQNARARVGKQARAESAYRIPGAGRVSDDGESRGAVAVRQRVGSKVARERIEASRATIAAIQPAARRISQ